MKTPELEKVIGYCERNIPHFEYYHKNSDMEYDDQPLLVGYWWVGRNEELRVHNIFEFIENNYNVDIDWQDQWAGCIECYGAVRTSPTSYGWEPSYITTEYGYVCHECCKENPEILIKEYKNDINKAVFDWGISLIENEGYKCLENDEMYCERYQSGFHRGMNDTPEKVIKHIEEVMEIEHINDMFDYIFVVTETSQFYINFTIFLKPIEEEK